MDLQPPQHHRRRLAIRDMSEMETVSVEARIPYLPKEVISRILKRVPPDVESLFRCAMVCKPWQQIVADPAFLRSCNLCPADGKSWILGFFLKRRADVSKNSLWLPPSRVLPAFVPLPGSALGPRSRLLSSFVRDDNDVFDGAMPLAARGGLLLLRVRSLSMELNANLQLCVCNLLTSKWDLLPSLNVTARFGAEGPKGYAVLTAADHSGASPHQPSIDYSTFFRVLVIGGNRRLHVCAFSSDGSDRWFYRSLPELLDNGFHLHGCRDAEVCDGSAHWLLHDGVGKFCTIGVSIKSGEIRATHYHHRNVPILRADESSARLCTTVVGGEAKLSLILALRCHMTVVTLEDREDELVADLDLPRRMVTVCAADKSCNTLLMIGRSDPVENDAYLLDLQSGTETMVEGESDDRSLNYRTAVLCEVNLLEFMEARLGAIGQE